MSIPEDVRAFNVLVTTSFDNAMDTVESVHRNAMELYLGLLTDVGFPAERADALAARHRQFLRRAYGAVCTINHDLGDMIVEQVENVSRFAESIGVPLPDSPSAEVANLTRLVDRRRGTQ
jgi:hypothetical protein